MGIGYWYNLKAFDVFPLTPAETMTMALFRAIWPGATWTVMDNIGTANSEHNYLEASPFGEGFDVLLPMNLTATTLGMYRAILVTGDVTLDGDALAAVRQFVREGGVILLTPGSPNPLLLDATFVGATLSPQPMAIAGVTGAVDQETDWASSPVRHVPFCASDDSGAAFYIKVLVLYLTFVCAVAKNRGVKYDCYLYLVLTIAPEAKPS